MSSWFYTIWLLTQSTSKTIRSLKQREDEEQVWLGGSQSPRSAGLTEAPGGINAYRKKRGCICIFKQYYPSKELENLAEYQQAFGWNSLNYFKVLFFLFIYLIVYFSSFQFFYFLIIWRKKKNSRSFIL